jgi:hypothetical protein
MSLDNSNDVSCEEYIPGINPADVNWDNSIIEEAHRLIAKENEAQNAGDQERLNYFAGQIQGLNLLLKTKSLETNVTSTTQLGRQWTLIITAKKGVVTNLKDNHLIANKILKKINNSPGLRFYQILIALGIVDGEDNFYEESYSTLKRMKVKEGGGW